MVHDLLWALREPVLDRDTTRGALHELFGLGDDPDRWRLVAAAARSLTASAERPAASPNVDPRTLPSTPGQLLGLANAGAGGQDDSAGSGGSGGSGDSGGSGGFGGGPLGPIGTKLLLTNDLVNVWEVRLEPGQAQGWHRHDYPYVILGLEKGTSRITNTEGQVRTALPGEDPGFAVFDPGGATHMLENVGNVRIVDRLIEFKTALRDDLVRQVYIPGAS
jgi:quercetin dioxygenase-like cupin family protein